MQIKANDVMNDKGKVDFQMILDAVINIGVIMSNDNTLFIKNQKRRLFVPLAQKGTLYREIKELFAEDIRRKITRDILDKLVKELLISSEIHFDMEYLYHPELLNVNNGVWSFEKNSFLTDEELENVYFRYFLDFCIDEKYNPSIVPDALRKMLSGSFNVEFDETGNSVKGGAAITLLFESIGYLISEDNSKRKAVLFMGATASGKSTLAALIGRVIKPDINVTCYSLSRLTNEFSCGVMAQAKLNISEEFDVTSMKSLELFKLLVGSKKMTINKKYGDDFTVDLTAKMCFCGNGLPDIRKMDYKAIFDRFLINLFPNSIDTKTRIENLGDKLWEERNLIFTAAVMAYSNVYKNGQFTYVKEVADKCEIFNKDVMSAELFVDECLDYTPGANLSSKRLIEKYSAFCKLNNLCCRSKQILFDSIKTKFADKVQYAKVRDNYYQASSLWGFKNLEFKIVDKIDPESGGEL